jgi:Fic family protein
MKPSIPHKLPLNELDWVRFIPLIGKANRAIAQYEGILYGVPNPEVLLSPLTTQEAVLSSRIEGTRSTLDEVLRFEAGEEAGNESRRQDIQEIINYRRALLFAEQATKERPFNLNMMLDMHSILLDSVRGRDKGRGRFRRIQNWIGPPGTPIESAEYVPPEPMYLKEHLDNWEKYYHADEKDPLVHLAILHAQFEIIHPFIDGNGRLGRIIFPLYLFEKGLLSRPMFYLSAYLDTNKESYYSHLRLLNGPESWNEWITFFLNALIEQAIDNTKKASGILNLYQEYKEKVLGLTHSQYGIPMLDSFFRTPVFTSFTLIKEKSMPSKPTIMHILKLLRKAGILKVIREGSGRRPQVLALANLINLCEGKEIF